MVVEVEVNDEVVGTLDMSLYRVARDDPTPMQRKRRRQ
jgi:hypothetical protein